MIKVQNLSYSYPQKDLYDDVSFTIEDDVHCALIGTNGTGKSTLLNLLMHPEAHLYDGKVETNADDRIGYVSQFSQVNQPAGLTVFQYISREFVALEQKIADLCTEMAHSTDLETLFETYQHALDTFSAMDGDSYEVNIKKRLKIAGLQSLEHQPVSNLSGGEFKLVQVMREMLLYPGLLIMDEPDVFLDFEHLNALRNLINAHRGTLVVITHSRYLLNHCFNKILHLEGRKVREFDGTYIEYNYELLATKIDLEEATAADQAEIDRQSKITDLAREKATEMDNATLGSTVHARQSHLDRLIARKTKAPFVEITQPEFCFEPEHAVTDDAVLVLTDYSVSFDAQLLDHVNFELKPGEHVAIVGRNGTGKTTMLREIYAHRKSSIQMSEEAKLSLFSQTADAIYAGEKTLLEIFEEKGLYKRDEAAAHLRQYGLDGETLSQKASALSGGEKDLFQFAVLALEGANFLLLDEPTGHLDVYAQIALEQAILAYQGSILMVSHDFYTVSNCVDYVLWVENNTVRRMKLDKFRKMIYANHFGRDYLHLEAQKKEAETNIQLLLQKNEFEAAKALMEPLGKIIQNMKAALPH